jgi:hypothetical protein
MMSRDAVATPVGLSLLSHVAKYPTVNTRVDARTQQDVAVDQRSRRSPIQRARREQWHIGCSCSPVMKNMMALLGIATALLVGCADEPQERTYINHKFPADFDAVQVNGGVAGQAPTLAVLEVSSDALQLGDDEQTQTFVDFEQEVVDGLEGEALSNGLGQTPDIFSERGAIGTDLGQNDTGTDELVAFENNEQVGELSALPSGTPDACECATEDCVANWIDENLGCNICVLFTCGDEPYAAGCNACP